MRSIFLSNKASLLAAETLLPIEDIGAIAAADLPCLFFTSLFIPFVRLYKIVFNTFLLLSKPLFPK